MSSSVMLSGVFLVDGTESGEMVVVVVLTVSGLIMLSGVVLSWELSQSTIMKLSSSCIVAVVGSASFKSMLLKDSLMVGVVVIVSSRDCFGLILSLWIGGSCVCCCCCTIAGTGLLLVCCNHIANVCRNKSDWAFRILKRSSSLASLILADSLYSASNFSSIFLALSAASLSSFLALSAFLSSSRSFSSAFRILADSSLYSADSLYSAILILNDSSYSAVMFFNLSWELVVVVVVLFGGSVDGEDRIFVRFLKGSPSSRFRIRILGRSTYFCSTILLDCVIGLCLFRMMVVGAVAVEGAVVVAVAVKGAVLDSS